VPIALRLRGEFSRFSLGNREILNTQEGTMPRSKQYAPTPAHDRVEVVVRPRNTTASVRLVFDGEIAYRASGAITADGTPAGGGPLEIAGQRIGQYFITDNHDRRAPPK
jgi:hypothetical protein